MDIFNAVKNRFHTYYKASVYDYKNGFPQVIAQFVSPAHAEKFAQLLRETEP